MSKHEGVRFACDKVGLIVRQFLSRADDPDPGTYSNSDPFLKVILSFFSPENKWGGRYLHIKKLYVFYAVLTLSVK